MRRAWGVAVIGLAILVLLLAGAVTAERRARLDVEGLQKVGLILPGTTFSRIATDRPCPGLGPDEVTPPTVPGTLRLVPVAKAEEPTSAAFLPDGSGNGFLSERPGRVRRVTAGALTDDVLLDLTEDTFHDGDGGLLALAVDPAGTWLYTERTVPTLDDVITAYPITADGGLDVDHGRVIIHSDHPTSIQHHGGSLAFDSHGLLYFGFGDGGGLGDPRENAQRLTTLLGKINRIRPTPEGRRPYEIPDDNPFAHGGRVGARPEIWLYGVRNPFRLSFDPADDSIWLGDVGQSCWEEVDHLPVASAGGGNLGWDVKEGTHDFEDGPLPTPVIDPVYEINHRRGWCAIVVGPVQRGDALPSLDGRLLVSDYCHGHVLSFDPAHPADYVDTGLMAKATIAIVRGPAGRPWVLTLDGQVLEIRDR